ncbi:MFS transporter [Bifidobacterium pseudocatenulatum]|nr:MFS transporter [Bifidobacterium pseudocatenulatum]
MMARMEKNKEIFGLPLMFWGLWVTLLILWMGRFVTSFLSMYLVSDMHVSAGVAGTIVSMYGFGGIFGCLYGGALSDRFGRPAMIVIGNLGSAAMLVLLAFIGNPWIMAIALLVYGAISSMPTPAVAAYVSDVVPFRKQKRAYSLQTWAANFGFAIGPIIANQLVKISYALMFYAEAAVLVFATILMIVFFKEVGLGKRPRGEVAPARASQSAESAAGNAVEHAVKQTGESQRPQRFSVWRSYRRACADGALMSMVVLMFLYTLAYYQIVSGLPISMTQIGLGTDEYSSLLTINGGLLCLLQIPAIGLFQRMSNTRVLVLGMSITAVGYAFQIGANSWVAFAIATVLWTLGELGTFPIAATTVANIAPKDVRGTYQGLYNLVWSLSNAFSPLVGGWILNAFGSRVLWICCTVMFVIVAIGFYVTRGPRERAAARNLAAEEA